MSSVINCQTAKCPRDSENNQQCRDDPKHIPEFAEKIAKFGPHVRSRKDGEHVDIAALEGRPTREIDRGLGDWTLTVGEAVAARSRAIRGKHAHVV